LQKRTLDHSYVEQKPPMTNVSAEFLAKMANRNVLFTCLGSPTKPIYDVSESVALKHGDRFMLCSDGLWGHLSEPDIVEGLAQAGVDQSIPFLIDLALKRGGKYGDNVSAIGLEWEDEAISTRPSKSLVMTKTLGKEVFASTIHKHIVDIDKNAFDDLDIEHSLREINEAIQKSLPKIVTQ
jgi:hypothetical protein